MFKFKEMIDALCRMQSVDELPAFVCIAIDVEGNFSGCAAGFLGDYSEKELPRVCLDCTEYLLSEGDGKKKIEKKIEAFQKFMDGKFHKHFWEEIDLGKKFRENKFRNYYVRDFRLIPTDMIIKDDKFKGQQGLMITMGAGPKH